MKVKKIRRLIERGIYDADIARYIPGTLDLVFQGMIEKIMTIEQPADTTYSDKEILDFELILDNNYYTNLKSLHLCFPIRFKKLSNIAHNLDADIYPVNNFFAHWIRETDITKYGTNKSLIPMTTPKEIYRYSDSMLKHLQKNALKMVGKNQSLFPVMRTEGVITTIMKHLEQMTTSRIKKISLWLKLIQNTRTGSL